MQFSLRVTGEPSKPDALSFEVDTSNLIIT